MTPRQVSWDRPPRPRDPRGEVLARGSPGPPESAGAQGLAPAAASTAEKHTEASESLKGARTGESPGRRKALHRILVCWCQSPGGGGFGGGGRTLRAEGAGASICSLWFPCAPALCSASARTATSRCPQEGSPTCLPRSPPGLDLGRQGQPCPAVRVTVGNIPESPAHPACTRARSAREVSSHLFIPSEFRGPAQL